MEMRAIDDVGMGRDLTPALPPLSHALHDSFLSSHCSACFSPLPAPPLPASPAPVLYCSQTCSSSDSLLHSSAELQLLRNPPAAASDDGDTSDLRAALRLLASLGDSPCRCGSQRIAGLLTNRDKLLADGAANSEIFTEIQSGAKAMAAARKSQRSSSDVCEDSNSDSNSTTLEEAALCAVLMNAVEVHDNEGRSIGIAIYGTDFSWINHSCSPNACYRFQFSPASSTVTAQCPSMSRMWISPYGYDIQMDNGALGCIRVEKELGPRITVRSIKPIKKGTEVTVAYTDLLQPKSVRRSELLLKYQFTCHCTRCSSEPPIYVDRSLQSFHAVNFDFPMKAESINSNQDEAIEKLTGQINEVIADYLSDGDAESCCLKLEKLLMVRVTDEELGLDEKSVSRNHCLQLHPLHYLSIEAHTTLASAYKVRGSLLTTLATEEDGVNREASDLIRIGAAYSLLLGGAVHRLFCSESSLIVSTVNFWANAGESLLNLARSSAWPDFMELDSLVPTCPSSENNTTSMYCLLNLSDSNSWQIQASYADFQQISNGFLNCITHFTGEAWDFLRHGCPYLQQIRDPISYCWLGTDSDYCFTGIAANVSVHELGGWIADKRRVVFQLGLHCALYSEFLSSICYGEGSHLTSHIKRIFPGEKTL